jgi:hypothetical protein
VCAKVFFIPCSNGFRSQNQHCSLNPFGAFLKHYSIAFAILPSIAGGLALYLNSFTELRQTFPSAGKVGNLTVFNIGGNKARLIAAVHYNIHRIYIRHILTHKEYNRGSWRKE